MEQFLRSWYCLSWSDNCEIWGVAECTICHALSAEWKPWTPWWTSLRSFETSESGCLMTAPLPIRLESFAEEFLAFCGIWHYLLFSQNVPYSVRSNYLLLSVDLWGSNHMVQSCVNIVMGSCLFAFVFSTFPLSWGMKQHNWYDNKAVSWTTEKLIYSGQRTGVFLFSTTCTPSLGSTQSHHGFLPLG